MEESILSYLSGAVILMIIGGLVTVALGFLSSRYKGEITPLWISWCTVAGGLVILISGVWSSIEQARFQRTLVDKSQKIESLQKNLSSILTGGGSFAYVDITIAKDPAEDYLQFNVIHKGEFPLYDLTVKVTDQDHSRDLLRKAKLEGIPLTIQYFDKAKRIMPFGTLGPGRMISGCAAYLMPSDILDRNFLIEINSRYDQLYQNIHVHRNTDGRLSFDNMVKRGDKVIYSSGNTKYFEREVTIPSAEQSGYRWTLKDQGETLTFLALEGRWYAFDARGKLVEPEIIK